MRKALAIRLVITLIVAFVGAAWFTQLDGQIFNNSLVFIGCMIACALICFGGARDQKNSYLIRYLWRIMAFILLIVIGMVAVMLPGSYRYQEEFNTTFPERVRKLKEEIFKQELLKQKP